MGSLTCRSLWSAPWPQAHCYLGGGVEPANAQSSQTYFQTYGIARSPQTLAAGNRTRAEYQTLYVNPTSGNNSAQGTASQPLQTVTRALEIAPPNTVIVLAPGRYTRASGEVFPLQLKSGVTIQGAPGERDRTAIIEGGGNFNSPARSRQNAAVIAADRAGIAQVAISNPDGYGVWVESVSPTILETAFVGNRQTGIYIASGSPRVQGNYFSGNEVAGLIVFGLSSATVQSNIFEDTGDAIRVVEGATPEIIGNRMTNNEAGLVVIGNANPILRDNQMVGNRRDDVVEVAGRAQDIASPTDLALSEDTLGADLRARNLNAVPEPADAVPGERAGNFSRGNFSLEPIQPVVQMAVLPAPATPGSQMTLETRSPGTITNNAPVLEADAIPGLQATRPSVSRPPVLDSLGDNLGQDSADLALAPEPSSRASISERASDLNTVSFQPETQPSRPSQPIASRPAGRLLSRRQEVAEPAVDIAVIPASESSESSLEADAFLEADAVPGETRPAGAPGAALEALQSGVPMASRAMTDGNPDSIRLIRRRRRRPAEEQTEVTPSNASNESSVNSAPVNNNRLAVPSSAIPIGSGGSTTIFSAPRSGVGAPPAPPSRAQAMGLYYRVFVEASDPFLQDEVRSVVPDAFRTNFEGRTVMQVGAFPTEEEAEDRRRLLERNDLNNVRIEYIR
ncbi:MAG: DUF1565 domain-containing protein [Cyanobacteria bacterium P01_F01_bin.53]